MHLRLTGERLGGRCSLAGADEAVAEGYRYGTYVAVCGELMERSGLARADCDDDCECKGVAFCLACLRAATQRAWAAGGGGRLSTPGVRVMEWGLSVLDWRSHAIDERADHPTGVYRAECGHLLMMLVALDDRPNGKPCAACAPVSSSVGCGLIL